MILTEGIYEIKEGYKAIIIDRGTKIQIKKRAAVAYNGPRCRDCVHCQRGKYAFSPGQWWESAFCNAKPKTVAGDSRFFYSTDERSKACDCPLFEKKNML